MTSLVLINSKNEAVNLGDNSLFLRFVKFLQVREASAKTYKASLKSFFNYLASKSDSKNIDRQTIIDYKESLLRAGKSANTVNLYLTTVKKFFSWLEEEGLYKNIAKNVKNERISEDHKRDSLSTAQVCRILDNSPRGSLEALRNYVLFFTAVNLGLRTIELHRLTLSDLRHRNGRPVIYLQGKGRTSKDAFLPIGEELRELLGSYIAKLGKVPANAPLFPSFCNRTKGMALSTRAIRWIIKGMLVKNGLNSPRLSAHSLRHTAATEALRAGAPLESVKMFLRHRSLNTTLIYNHALEQESNPVSNILGKLFAPKSIAIKTGSVNYGRALLMG